MKDREPTTFERRVYEATSRIPRGKVTTYRQLAHLLECGSSQAVGQALKRNPYAPEVPCHRVIRGDLTIGGFAGQTGGEKIRRKLALLRSEGVDFDVQGKLRETERLWTGERENL